MDYEIRQVTADEMPLLYTVRSEVLRPGRPPESAVFPGDDDPTTAHFGAFTPNGKCLGVATLMENKGTQLRGMAVVTEAQGQGVGAALLNAVQEWAVAQGKLLLWCNARLAAVPFYERLGWEIVSEQFDVPAVGPHYIMQWKQA